MNRVKITGVSSPILSRSAPLGQKPEAAPDSVQLSAGVPLAGLVPTAFPVAPFPRLDSQGMTLGQLGGHSAARQELQQLAETLKNGQPAPFSSYLIEGNSGAGKTSLVRALSGELAGLGVTTLHAEAADFSEGGPPKIRQLFAEAQQQASMSPLKTCLVLIDEVEAIDAVSFAPRGTSNAAVFLKSTTNPASTFEWYMAEVASNLAGRTAESLFGQGHVSAGPGGDIGFATTLAGEAVRQKGMGRNLGPVNPSNDIQHRQANDDEMAINRVGDQIATSTVEFYRDFIDNYAAQMVAKRSDLKQLTVSGRELQDQLRAWQHATPERSQQLTQLKAQIREAIQSIKPLPSPGL